MIATRVDSNADSDSESEIGATTTGRSASIDLAHAESEAGITKSSRSLAKAAWAMCCSPSNAVCSGRLPSKSSATETTTTDSPTAMSKVTAALDHPVVIPVHDAADDFLVMCGELMVERLPKRLPRQVRQTYLTLSKLFFK